MYRAARHGFYLLCRALDVRLHLHGVEHLPSSGPVLLAANHISFFDWAFASWPLPAHGDRPLRFLAQERWFGHPITGPLIRATGTHIPVGGGPRPDAFRSALEALRRGEVVVVFPEGKISRSLELGRFRRGAAQLALEAEAPIVPVALWGCHLLWSPDRRPTLRSVRHAQVTVRYGTPLTGQSAETSGELNRRLRASIEVLLEATHRSAA